MADVTGSFGNEYVELNNAATEATLKLLLQATLAANKQTLDSVKNMAKASGLDPAAVAQVNTGIKTTTPLMYKLGYATGATIAGFEKLDKAVSPLIGKLLQGQAQASDAFSTLAQIGGPAGVVAGLFGKIAAYQEKNMEMYQQISSAGVNFGGSLTGLRQAALNTYMTLDQFTSLMKNNSEAFARMGGTADQGAKSFVKLSNSLLSSEAGDELRALGFTTEEVNNGLANYLANTGARTKQEMQNTAAINAGAKEYLTQLDALAQVTGKSREQQEKALKEANANAAFEAYKMTLDEEGRKKLELGLAQMSAKFGKAGADLYKSQALGLPPMTEASQKLQAIAPRVAQASNAMVQSAQSATGTTADILRSSAEATAAAAQESKKFGKTTAALSFGSDSTSQALMGLQSEANRAKAQQTETTAAGVQQQAEIAEAQRKRQESEARTQVETQKAMQEMGQAINALIAPIVQVATPIIKVLAQVVSGVVKFFESLGTTLTVLTLGLTAFGLALLKTRSALGGDGGGGGGLLGALKGGATAPGSRANPMFVNVVNGGGLGGGGSGPAGAAGKGAGGVLGRLGGGLKGFGLGAVGSIAGGMAADALGRDTTAGKSADVLGTAAGWAGTGALLGSVVPGVGNVVGGAIGGLLGAGYGAYQNFFKDAPKAAMGAVVSSPTTVQVAENEPELISPLKNIEMMQAQLGQLNKQTAEMIKFMKETAEYSRQTADATKALNGDAFA